MNLRSLLALLGAGGLLAAAPASAQVTVTHTYDFHKYGPFSIAETFPGVDPSLGTLVDVEVAAWYRVDLTFRVENQNPFEVTSNWGGIYGPFYNMGADNQDWRHDHSYSVGGSPSVTLAPFDGTADLAGTSSYEWKSSSGDLFLFPKHPDLGLYDWLNSPQIPFSLSLQLWHNIVGEGDMVYDYAIEVTGQQTLTYTYIPEPATYAALCGLGVLGFVVLRRFRRQR